MRRVLLIFMTTLVVCGGLIGCANSPKEISETMGSVIAEEENSVRNAISETKDADTEETGAEEYSGETIEYALSAGGIFVLNSDSETVEPLDLYALSFHALDDERDVCIGGDDPIVLDRKLGAKLIFIDESEYGFYGAKRVLENGYTVAEGTESCISAYDKVDGITVSDFSDEETGQFLAERGIILDDCRIGGRVDFLKSATSCAFDAEWYEGTQWESGMLRLETPYYIFDDSEDLDGSIPTKNGYFEVDTSNWESGLYLVQMSVGGGNSGYASLEVL